MQPAGTTCMLNLLLLHKKLWYGSNGFEKRFRESSYHLFTCKESGIVRLAEGCSFQIDMRCYCRRDGITSTKNKNVTITCALQRRQLGSPSRPSTSTVTLTVMVVFIFLKCFMLKYNSCNWREGVVTMSQALWPVWSKVLMMCIIDNNSKSIPLRSTMNERAFFWDDKCQHP